jgi:hypothetical protein
LLYQKIGKKKKEKKEKTPASNLTKGQLAK